MTGTRRPLHSSDLRFFPLTIFAELFLHFAEADFYASSSVYMYAKYLSEIYVSAFH